MNSGTRRVAQIAFVALALMLGTATATALAKHGADDGPGSTTGTTPTTQTGTTPTTGTTPPPPAPARRIRVVGTVSASDAAARTFTLTVKNRKRCDRRAHASKRGRRHRATRICTVQAGELTIPAVGRQVLVKGTVDGTTITATRVKVLRGEDNPHRGPHGEDHHRGGDDHGRGRGRDDRGGRDDHGGRDDRCARPSPR
jgi:hypothetical protein